MSDDELIIDHLSGKRQQDVSWHDGGVSESAVWIEAHYLMITANQF